MSEPVKSILRQWRNERHLNLEEACELFAKAGFEKPSIAKLSRIERDQDIPLKMIPAVEAVTGIPAKELCPDLAKMFGGLND